MKKQVTVSISILILAGILLATVLSCSDDDNNEFVDKPNTFKDPRDGNVYNIVTIGNQTWMLENLKYLPRISSPSTSSKTTPNYYVYGYDGNSITQAKATTNYKTYGVLYNWEAAKEACPPGWHLPSDEEWKNLTTFLGGESVSGGKLKEIGVIHWASPNLGATNEVGFTALPGGNLDESNLFLLIGVSGHWWSATEANESNAWYRGIYRGEIYAGRNYNGKEFGFSVRCIKD